jgi:protein TonB
MDELERMESARYGSFELKHAVGTNLMLGLLASVIIHSLVIVPPYLAWRIGGRWAMGKAPAVVLQLPPDDIFRLFPQHQTPPQLAAPLPPSAGRAVRPVAVPEEPQDATQPQVPTGDELARLHGAIPVPGDGSLNGPLVIAEPPTEEEIPPPDIYRAVEVQPVPLPDFMIRPQYPELARMAGVAGRVVVKVYVDKNGNVRDWVVLSVHPQGLGFEEEVLKVVPKWKFTPAIQGGNPIGVWVSVPFRFSLKR